ncbi:MAG: hypothetical protein KC474_08460 [Cyanobacteria bacterium HKST-UBA04]|nr:hypothetical protein [Cyanobacteria bacterium HKST-UBA04]
MAESPLQPPSQSPASPYGPVPVLDIISFGFRQFIAQLKPFALLSLPIIVSNTVIGAALNTLQLAPDAMNKSVATSMAMVALIGIQLVNYLLIAYLVYVYLKYVCDWFNGQVGEHLWDYFQPDDRLWGALGMGLIYGVVSLVLGLITVVGFFLILPGLVMVLVDVYLSLRFSQAMMVYFMEPKIGVMAAFGKSWRLVNHDQLWRVLGLGLIMTIIISLLSVPAIILEASIGVFSVVGNGFMGGLRLPIIFVGLLVSTFISLVIHLMFSTGAGLMVQARLYKDLVHRLAHVPSDHPISQVALLGGDGGNDDGNEQFGNTLSQDTLSQATQYQDTQSQDTLPQDTLPQDTV